MIRVSAAGRTDTGRVREANEDAFHVGDSVYAVADGMGGHLAGEVASSLALGPIADLDGRVFADDQIALAALRDAVAAANRAVAAKAARDPAMRGMGTTLTAVLVEGRRAHIAHVGDSRAYLHRAGYGLCRLTHDHTLGELLESRGLDGSKRQNVLTQAVGGSGDVPTIEARRDRLVPGDRLLLCTDGVSGFVSDDRLGQLVGARASVDDIVESIMREVLATEARDNLTAVVAEVA